MTDHLSHSSFVMADRVCMPSARTKWVVRHMDEYHGPGLPGCNRYEMALLALGLCKWRPESIDWHRDEDRFPVSISIVADQH
jgi:hypothetical protein